MEIFYDSLTGNVENFVNKIVKKKKIKIIKITEDTIVEKPSHFITYTTGFGEVSEKSKKFLKKNNNYRLIKTVSVSGNRNWGKNFGRAGDIISKVCKIKLLKKFELSGTNADVEEIIKLLKEEEGY